MERKRIINSESVLLLIFAVVVAISGILLHSYAEFRSNNIVTQDFDGKVVNKFISTATDYTYDKEYNITLEFDINGNKKKTDIVVDEEIFNKRDTYGETIPCSVSYDNIGIVEVKVLDADIKHSNNNSLAFSRIMSQVLFITAIISCIVEVLILRENIKDYKKEKVLADISESRNIQYVDGEIVYQETTEGLKNEGD